MEKIYDSLLELVGRTPLVRLGRIERCEGLAARLVAKVESFNPGSSQKDRAARAMIEAAERSGRLKPGGTLVEPTSGNTGVGLAWVAAVKGYRLVLTMPDTMSGERRSLLRALGAELVLTPGAQGMKGAIAEAEAICAATPGALILGQFDNPANPQSHFETTAVEIWDDTAGEIDVFVAGVGTGGTLSGTGAGLKSRKPDVRVIAVEPKSSPVLSGGTPGPHRLQGIGAGFIPANYHAEVVDEIIAVADDDAVTAVRMLARTEGLMCGVSSGAALWAAVEVARRPEMAGRTIVVLLPDTGERYLSTGLFE